MIDSHAHLTCEALHSQVEGIILRAKEAGIKNIVNICTDKITLERGLALAKLHPMIFNTAATTPHDVEKEGETLFPLMEKHAIAGDLVAVGETGLDYYYEHSNRKVQHHFLIRYLALAASCRLPVVIHCRDAFSDLFSILDGNAPHLMGVLHCFTGTLEDAKEVINRNWVLSLSGIVTFKKSTPLQEVARWVPLDHLLIETDSPYLAPQSKRGKQNEPSYLPEIAQFIASIKGIPVEDLIKATRANTEKLFSLTTKNGSDA